MGNSRQRREELIGRYLSGIATANERDQLERLYSNAALSNQPADDLEIEALNQSQKTVLLRHWLKSVNKRVTI